MKTQAGKEHIKRVEPAKLTKQIVDFMNLEGQKEVLNWISTRKEDIDAAAISQVDISDRKTLQANDFGWESWSEGKAEKDCNSWSGERKRRHSEIFLSLPSGSIRASRGAFRSLGTYLSPQILPSAAASF